MFNIQVLHSYPIYHLVFCKIAKIRGFVAIYIETYRSVTHKEMFCLNLWKLLWNREGFQIQLETQ